jgi:hypothetical protein
VSFTTGIAEGVAQDRAGHVDIAKRFHLEQRTFHCRRFEVLRQYFADLPREKVLEQLELEFNAIKIVLKSQRLSFKERLLISRSKRMVKKLLKKVRSGKKPSELKSQLCRGAEGMLHTVVKGAAWGANAIMSAAVMPFQALGKLTRGLIKGRVRPNDGEIHYDIIGPRLYDSGSSNLLLSQTYLELALAQPWVLPLIAAPAIDNEIMKICKRKNSLREEEKNFCRNFIGFKQDMLKVSNGFERFGAKIHQLFSKKNSNQTDDIADENLITEDEILSRLQDMNENNFCQRMVELGQRYNQQRKLVTEKANRELWRKGTNPERYGIPEIATFQTSTDNLYRYPSDRPMETLRNVIISVAPPAWKLEGVDQKEVRKAYRKNFKRFKKLARKGQRIFKNSKSVQHCEKLRRRLSFDYKEFEELSERISSDHIGKRLHENHVIKRQTSLTTKLPQFLFQGTALKWELIEAGDIATIDRVLKSNDIANVIIFIHGTKAGKVIDSHMNELPRGFFDNLSPSIVSLNFFSCYSQELDDYYDLSQAFSKGPTYWPIRHLSFVEIDEDYSYARGQVPFESFPGYLDKIDRYLVKSMKGLSLFESLGRVDTELVTDKRCSLKIENFKNQKVTFSVFVNNNHIGVVNPIADNLELSFNCAHLKKRNTIRFLDVDVSHDESFETEALRLSLNNGQEEQTMRSRDMRVIRSRDELEVVRAIIAKSQ